MRFILPSHLTRYLKFAPKQSQYVKATLLLHAHLYRKYLDLQLTSLHNEDLQVNVYTEEHTHVYTEDAAQRGPTGKCVY